MPSDIKEITTDAQMDEDGQISHCMNVAPSLFKANILIIVGFNLWGGTATVKPGDEAIFGSPNFDHKFFKRGGIILVDPAQLEEFQKERSKLVSWLNGVGQTFLVPGMRIFKKSEAHEVFQKVRECRIKFEELAEKFLANYDSIVLARTQQFDVDHPEHVGRLNQYYPSATKLATSFGVRCVPVSISDVDGMEDICSEEKDTFRMHIRSVVGELATEFRQTVSDAIGIFQKGINKADESESGDINSRTVTAFKAFLDRIEKNDFLGDDVVMKMIRDVRLNVSGIEDWNVKNNPVIRDVIGEQLNGIIRLAEDSVSTAAVVSALSIRNSSDVVVSNELMQEATSLGGLGSMSSDVVIDTSRA